MRSLTYAACALAFAGVVVGLLAALWYSEPWMKWTFGLGLVGVCLTGPMAIAQWWNE